MTGEKCISCNDRFPGCQDHCEYGRAAAAERPKGKTITERGARLLRRQEIQEVEMLESYRKINVEEFLRDYRDNCAKLAELKREKTTC